MYNNNYNHRHNHITVAIITCPPYLSLLRMIQTQEIRSEIMEGNRMGEEMGNADVGVNGREYCKVEERKQPQTEETNNNGMG